MFVAMSMTRRVSCCTTSVQQLNLVRYVKRDRLDNAGTLCERINGNSVQKSLDSIFPLLRKREEFPEQLVDTSWLLRREIFLAGVGMPLYFRSERLRSSVEIS